MAYFRCGGGGIPATLKTDMNSVLNKKFGTISQDYPPNEWADDVNLLGKLPERTASGSIAHFTDGADTVPLKSCTLTLAPTQSGTGDPSPTNPRPITGVSSVNVTQTGKNLISSSNICVTVARNDLIFDKSIQVNKGVTYTCSISNVQYATNWRFAYRFYDKQGNNILNAITNGYVTFTPALADTYDSGKTVMQGSVSTTTSLKMEVLKDCYVTVGITSGDVSGSTTLDYQIEVGSTPSTYSVYTGTPHTLDLGQTCYGVTGDVVTGEFEETYERVKISSLNWTAQSNLSRLYTADLQGSIDTSKLMCCEFAKGVPWDNVWTNIPLNSISVASSGNVFFKTTDYATTEDFLQDWGDYYLCYPLATPTELTTDPVEVDSFEGVNCLWCTQDNSNVAVEYRADIDLLISELGG